MTAHITGGRGDRATARTLPAITCCHKEAYRGLDRARVLGAHA